MLYVKALQATRVNEIPETPPAEQATGHAPAGDAAPKGDKATKPQDDSGKSPNDANKGAGQPKPDDKANDGNSNDKKSAAPSSTETPKAATDGKPRPAKTKHAAAGDSKKTDGGSGNDSKSKLLGP